MKCTNKELKEKLVNVLEAFISICKKHNLRYSIIYGTLLGAVRHKGFIPWDDDIDVVMPRPDYEKLLSVANNVFEGKYKITSIHNDKNYMYPFAKLYDINTTLIEFKDMVYLGGIYIDIFPLDGVPINTAKYIKRIYKINYAAIHLLKAHQSWKYKFQILPKYIIYKLLYWNHHLALKKCDKLARKYPFIDGNDFISYFGWCKEKDIYKYSWFTPLNEYSFEGTKVLGPNNYNACLEQVYGDYMTPPPIEKRISNHSHYFIDLTRRYTLEEIREMGY